MSGFNSTNNLGTYGRNKYSIGIGSRRSGSGSMARVFNYCNKGSTDLNVVLNCTFNTNYFTPTSSEETPNDYYLTGLFYTDPLTILGSDGNIYFNNTINTDFGNSTAYLLKYNNDGIPQWATKIGFDDSNCYINDYNNSSNIVIDKENNVYTCGLFINNDSPNSHNLKLYNSGNYTIPGIQLSLDTERNVYIAKYNTNGLAIWATHIQVTNAYNISVITDSESNIYVTFTYNSNNETKIYETNNNIEVKSYSAIGGGNDFIMIVSYNSKGKYRWSTIISTDDVTIGCGGVQIFYDKNNNIIVSGFVYSNNNDVLVNIYNQNDTSTPIANIPVSKRGIFIIKYSKAGFATWVTKIDGKSTGGKAVVTTDLNNNIYVCGFSNNAATPQIYSANGLGTPTLYATLPSSDDYDCFVVKYNSNGVAQLYTRITGVYNEYQPYISTNSNGNIIVAGTTESSSLEIFDKNNTQTDININTTMNNYNTFLVNFNTNGILEWATYLGPNYDESRVSIYCDNKNNIIVSGDYDEQSGGYNMKFYKPNGSDPIEVLSMNTYDSGNNNVNTFVVKYDSNGVPLWSSQNYTAVDMPIISCPYKY